MSARFRPPRSPTPHEGFWSSTPEVPQPPHGAPQPRHEPVPGDEQQPIGSPWPSTGRAPQQPGDGESPRRGVLSRAKRTTIGIGVVVVLAFFANLLLDGDRWSEAELEGDLAATLQRHSVVATSTTCNRHDQTVICTIRTVTPDVPPTFTVTGEIELISRKYADDDGDVNWEIPSEVLAP